MCITWRMSSAKMTSRLHGLQGPRSERRFMSHAHPGAGRVLPRRHLSSVQSIKSSKVNARIHDVGFFCRRRCFCFSVFVFPFLWPNNMGCGVARKCSRWPNLTSSQCRVPGTVGPQVLIQPGVLGFKTNIGLDWREGSGGCPGDVICSFFASFGGND